MLSMLTPEIALKSPQVFHKKGFKEVIHLGNDRVEYAGWRELAVRGMKAAQTPPGRANTEGANHETPCFRSLYWG